MPRPMNTVRFSATVPVPASGIILGASLITVATWASRAWARRSSLSSK